VFLSTRHQTKKMKIRVKAQDDNALPTHYELRRRYNENSSKEVDPSSAAAERSSRFTMIERHISSGKNILRTFLQSQRSSLSKAPILIISSRAGVDETRVPSVDHACRKAQFLTSMEMGLKTVQSNVSSAFPTTSQVQAQIDLLTRTGAKTILGVGSGAAMDLTKAVLQKCNGKGILVPSTYGAIIASTSSHAILLDTTEEALVVPDNSLESDDTSVVIETDELANTHGKVAAWACLAIGMDSLYRRGPDNDQGKRLLQQGLNALEDESHLPEALVSAGKALDFGVNDHLRSAPLALATSLIPPCFPSASVITMFASLLPGILQVSSGTTCDLETQVRNAFQDSTSNVPSLASLVVHSDAAQPVHTLLSHVRSNQALYKGLDVHDDVLEAILHYSLNR
jgi:hypothetical protein